MKDLEREVKHLGIKMDKMQYKITDLILKKYYNRRVAFSELFADEDFQQLLIPAVKDILFKHNGLSKKSLTADPFEQRMTAHFQIWTDDK